MSTSQTTPQKRPHTMVSEDDNGTGDLATALEDIKKLKEEVKKLQNNAEVARTKPDENAVKQLPEFWSSALSNIHIWQCGNYTEDMMRALTSTIADEYDRTGFHGIYVHRTPTLVRDKALITSRQLVLGYTLREDRWIAYAFCQEFDKNGQFYQTKSGDAARALYIWGTGQKKLPKFSKKDLRVSFGSKYEDWLFPKEAFNIDSIPVHESGPFVIWLLSRLKYVKHFTFKSMQDEADYRPISWSSERSSQLKSCREGFQSIGKTREFENRWKERDIEVEDTEEEDSEEEDTEEEED